MGVPLFTEFKRRSEVSLGVGALEGFRSRLTDLCWLVQSDLREVARREGDFNLLGLRF